MNFVSLFNPPDNCTAVRILFRLYGTGTIFFDDASCYKTEEPYYISLEADDGFYYTENEEGIATAKANLYSYPDLIGKNVEFKLVYKENAVVTQNIPINSEGKADFRFKMAVMVNKREEYSIIATVLNVTGNNSESIPVYKYDKPKKLDADGNYIIDGKIFNPVFLYHVNTDDYPKVKEAGINVVQGSASKSVLDAANQNGLKVIVCLYNNLPAGHPANVTATQKSVSDLMNHPAVFAWGIMDEPFSNDPGSEPYLLNSYKIIRDIDAVHPVYVMEDGNNFAVAAKYTDILGIDPYPSSSNVPTTHVATRTKRAFENCKKPIYNLLQAFSYNGYFPSTDELRNMLYQAFWEGSKAIGYYAFSESYGSIPLDKTVLWETMTKWYENESELAFEHFVSNANTLISENEGENAWWRTWQSDGETYALILNRSNTESVTVNVPVSTKTYSKVKIVGGAEGAGIKGVGNGYITINVKAGGAPLLRLVNFEENKVYFYQGNVIPNTIEDGTYSIGCRLREGTGGYIITSLYKNENNIKELTQIFSFDKVNVIEAKFFEKEITISNLENKKYELNTFLWDSSLKFLSPL